MKIALVGNQNSGKTTLFNDLTGSNQKIGNWPGVTIERKEGYLKGTKDIEVIDLPGIYSLSPYTSEEEVSRRFVIDEKPELIVNIVDSTSLERSLYLSTQLMELDADVVLVLNMTDILESHGIKIDVEALEKHLGVSIIQVSAQKGTGIDELINLIKDKKYKHNPKIKIYPEDIEEMISSFSKDIKADNKRFAAVKMIEDDSGYHALKTASQEEEIKKIETKYDMDGEQLIASKRYDFIENLKKDVLTVNPKKESMTDRLDRIFLHKYLAIPIFALLMAFIYFVSIGIVGGFTTPLINTLFKGATDGKITFNIIFTSFSVNSNFEGLGPWLSRIIGEAGGHVWSMSLVKDGVVAGVSSVLSFVPQIMVMFLFLSLLETCGYMSRIAFFLDRVFHKFGLSGKSLIPFIVGSGCSVPGILNARIVEDPSERDSTIVLTPFIPCSAKLPIISVLAGSLFGKYAWLVTLGSYIIGIAIILIFGLIFKKVLFKKEHGTFLSELPEYKKPKCSYIARDIFDKTWAFIKRAGTIIFLCSVLVWFLSSFSWNFRYLDGKIDQSILASIGNVFAWVFYPMLGGHWSWGASVSAIQGLIAKEQVVGSLTIIASLNGSESIISSSSPFAFFANGAGLIGLAYIMFNLFSAPCIGAISAMRKELGSTKKMFLAIGFQTSIAWVLSTLIGCIGWIIEICQR